VRLIEYLLTFFRAQQSIADDDDCDVDGDDDDDGFFAEPTPLVVTILS
jgi:hypothetical protein